MPVVTIEHDEYPSVVVIEYNSLYKNELNNFIRDIKLKDSKEEVYSEPYFFKIMQINNKNIGLLTIDGRIEGYYYVNRDNMLKYIYISYPYRRSGFGKLLIAHALKINSEITFDQSANQGYNRLINSPIFEDALKGNGSENSNIGFEDAGGSKEGELTLF